jgi:hypothetical protein
VCFFCFLNLPKLLISDDLQPNDHLPYVCLHGTLYFYDYSSVDLFRPWTIFAAGTLGSVDVLVDVVTVLM